VLRGATAHTVQYA